MKRVLVTLLVVLAPIAASAEPINVGLFAPSAPFPSTAARVELASRLGVALGAALHGPAAGRVYARAADFAAAVKTGEVTIALVDPAYLATAGGGYTVIAAALHAGDAERAWQLVARDGARLADLAGKRVLVPSLGGREADFVHNVLLGGELARGFFAGIEAAPDAASALAALVLGKADAAAVPAGELPVGITVVLAAPALPNPVLVAYGAMPPASRAAVLAAAVAFEGDATITGFRAADPEAVRGVARRFAAPVRRAPFLVPAPRLLVDALAAPRRFAIERTPATAFAIAPPPR
jgi:hypothetical protein